MPLMPAIMPLRKKVPDPLRQWGREVWFFAPLSLGEGAGVRLLFIILLVILYQFWHNLLNGANDHVVGNLVDWCLRVAVHGDDDA